MPLIEPTVRGRLQQERDANNRGQPFHFAIQSLGKLILGHNESVTVLQRTDNTKVNSIRALQQSVLIRVDLSNFKMAGCDSVSRSWPFSPEPPAATCLLARTRLLSRFPVLAEIRHSQPPYPCFYSLVLLDVLAIQFQKRLGVCPSQDS